MSYFLIPDDAVDPAYPCFDETGQFILNKAHKERANDWIEQQRKLHPKPDPSMSRFGFLFYPSTISCNEVYVCDRVTKEFHCLNAPEDFENL